MIKIEHIATYNFLPAIRGARNPMNSWALSDSIEDENGVHIGEKDLALLKKLCSAGSDHRKFLRQIFISLDITAPLYWWKEFDTYKVGTVSNSTSTMHKLHSSPINIEDFSTDQMAPEAKDAMQRLIGILEALRLKYLSTKDKAFWYSLIQLLPESYNQKRTITMDYENAYAMYFARKDHKLFEWQEFCKSLLSLPYFRQFIE